MSCSTSRGSYTPEYNMGVRVTPITYHVDILMQISQRTLIPGSRYQEELLAIWGSYVLEREIPRYGIDVNDGSRTHRIGKSRGTDPVDVCGSFGNWTRHAIPSKPKGR
ncbi:hypothetical protein H2248_012638 [Termitomyces sp. 'cryptogamus']|nr:hypothetical protein H2248_012638 [Termitomyces sp. 'cryptogamus']